MWPGEETTGGCMDYLHTHEINQKHVPLSNPRWSAPRPVSPPRPSTSAPPPTTQFRSSFVAFDFIQEDKVYSTQLALQRCCYSLVVENPRLTSTSCTPKTLMPPKTKRGTKNGALVCSVSNSYCFAITLRAILSQLEWGSGQPSIQLHCNAVEWARPSIILIFNEY